MAMVLVEEECMPIATTRRLYGQDQREIEGASKLKIQYLGPGAEVLVNNEGPPRGKKWTVLVQVHVSEEDA